MTQRDPRAGGGKTRHAQARRADEPPSLAGPPAAVVVMGVSGSGKTSVGRSLARALDYDFLDADDFHSERNVAKMASGQALTDGDREPWLIAVREAMAARLSRGEGVVMACSALRTSYRDVLRKAGAGVRFVYLQAGKRLIAKRLTKRSRHFFAPSLLDSQFATLEEPDVEVERDVRIVDATLARRRMPGVIIKALNEPR